MRYMLALVVFVNTVAAAPIPKHAQEPMPDLLNKELVGKWEYRWGQMSTGWIIFYEDGTFISKHEINQPTCWRGEWKVEKGQYLFREGSIDGDTGIFVGYGHWNKMDLELSLFPNCWEAVSEHKSWSIQFTRTLQSE